MPVRLFTTLLLFVSLAGAQGRDPLPVPDLPGYKTLKCDFHQHTVFSDGLVWPSVRVGEAWRDGLDAIAITDHADYRPHKQDVTPDSERPYELARATAEELGIILVRGIEISEGDTHCNALFVTDANALRGLKLAEAARAARAQGAFVFWNHPGWKSKPDWIPLIATLHEEKMLHGMELVNGDTFYPDAYPWVEEKRLAVFANSDVHGLSATGRARPITLVFARSADVDGVREALFARRTAAWMNNQIWGPDEQLRGLWQGALEVETPQLRRVPGRGGAGLRLRNRSAVPFRLAVRQKPAWLRVTGGELRAEGAANLPISVAKTAPLGTQQVELGIEVTNLHTGPKQELTIKLPLTIEVVAP